VTAVEKTKLFGKRFEKMKKDIDKRKKMGYNR